MKRLIVTADDFGLTEKVSQAIIEGHKNGIITSASLMANGAGFESAAAFAGLEPKLGVGVHLNLTEGRPVSEVSRIPSLVNSQGLFCAGPVRLARKIMAGVVRLVEVEREFRAQIEKVLTAGITPMHLDGHKHVHLWSSVFPIVIRLAREYRVRGVRCAAERSLNLRSLMRRNRAASLKILKQYLLGRALSSLALSLRETLRQARLLSPTHFYGITQTGFLDVKSLQEIISHLPQGTSEIMCHPGYVDTDLMRTPTRLLAARVEELHALTRPEIKSLITERGIELISYKDLMESV